MHIVKRCSTVVLVLSTGAWVPFAAGQSPTFSVEVAAVNSRPLPGGPARWIVAVPGDILTVEAYVRDWSVNGAILHAYQAQLEPTSFASGTKGYVEPVDYDATRDEKVPNNENCFIDQTHPRFVHAGQQVLPLVDTMSEGYRWMCVIIPKDMGPKSAQDGAKFYCGTVKMRVSDNAEGTFTLGLIEDEIVNSGLRNEQAVPIRGIKFESLTVVVDRGVKSDQTLLMVNGFQRSARIPMDRLLLDNTGTLGASALLRCIEHLNEPVDRKRTDASKTD